jgi:hypothetical protein
VPAPGDAVEIPGYTITVTEMDGRRIARLRVTPIPAPEPRPEPDPSAPELAPSAPEPVTEPRPQADAAADSPASNAT